MKQLAKPALVVAASVVMLGGCKSMNKTQKGAIIGTAGGAAVGAVIGKAAGNAGLGAILGAVVGGATGAVIGKKMDKEAKEIKDQVPGAKVERVGEGIVVEFNDAVLFGFNRSDLSAASKTNLDKLVTVLNKYSDTNLEVAGHTDSKGTDDYNQSLSEKRAETVASYVRSQGISSSRLTTRGYGESAPKYDNNSESNMAQNRRVEFLITANDKMISDAKKETNAK